MVLEGRKIIKIIKGKPRRLREIRGELGLTQAEFAKQLGVRQNTVWRWEAGELVPPKVAELAAEHLLMTQGAKKGDKHE